MSFFGAMLAGGAEGLAKGIGQEMDYQEKLDRERQLQAQRAQDRMDQISLMASLKEPGRSGGSKEFNVIERLMSAKSPEEQDQLIRLVQAGSGSADAADALFEAVGRPRANAVTPTAGEFSRFDRSIDDNGQSTAPAPASYLQRAQYDREAGARAIQQVLAVFGDPAKLKGLAEGQGQLMVNDQVRTALASGSDSGMRQANAAALVVGGKDRFGIAGGVVADKAGLSAPVVTSSGRDKAPSGYRYRDNGDLEAIPGGPGDKKLGTEPLPVSAAKSLLDNQVNLRRVQTALALAKGETVDGLTGDTNATGAKGVLPSSILNRMDGKGVDTRAAIADLGSLVIHDRSGAAVTAAEYPRLAPFIPAATDDSETVKKKLVQFERNYRAIVDDAADFYRASGYNVPQEVLRSGKPDNNSAIPRITSPADLQKLPSGSMFVAPDGKTRRKP